MQDAWKGAYKQREHRSFMAHSCSVPVMTRIAVFVQDANSLAAECSFHPGLMLAAAKGLGVPGSSIRAALRWCLEEDESQFVRRAQDSYSLLILDAQKLLSTMSLFPGSSFTPCAVISLIHGRLNQGW